MHRMFVLAFFYTIRVVLVLEKKHSLYQYEVLVRKIRKIRIWPYGIYAIDAIRLINQ